MDNVDLEELAKQFQGRKFGELVLLHIKQQSFEQLVIAVQDTIAGLETSIQTEVEELIDNANSLAMKREFWADDCGRILQFITSMTNTQLKEKGLNPTESELFDIFNIVVMSYAYSAQKDPRMRKFIASSAGKGFLGRLFG